MEWEGKGFVGLSAKTYYCFNNDPKDDKVSAKGINKSANISKEHFLAVKNTMESVSATNRGFVLRDNKMYTLIGGYVKHTHCIPQIRDIPQLRVITIYLK